MRVFLLVVLLFLAAALIALFMQEATPNRRTVSFGETALEVEVADTRAERNTGLSGREELGENEGMLFVYEAPVQPSFWMKDMRFAVDIIWIDSARQVVEITKEVAPGSYPEKFRPQSPVQYVLEAPAGWAERHGIQPGDLLDSE